LILSDRIFHLTGFNFLLGLERHLVALFLSVTPYMFIPAGLQECHTNKLTGGFENPFGSLNKIFSIAFSIWLVGFHLDLRIFE